jgi:hypothetical protein
MIPKASCAFWWSITYPTSITVDQVATVTIVMTTDTPVDLHVLFKAEFVAPPNVWTGHWTYSIGLADYWTFLYNEIVFSSVGSGTYIADITIPYDLYVESLIGQKYLPQNYYFYVFSTTPGGGWGTGADNKGPLYYGSVGGVDTTTVKYPPLDIVKEKITALRMIREKISPPPGQPDTWPAGWETLRTNLLQKLEQAADYVNAQQWGGVKWKLESFINELQSSGIPWGKVGECVEFATFILNQLPPIPVGGVWVPINKFELLVPWIGLASLLTVAAVSVVYVKRKKKEQN